MTHSIITLFITCTIFYITVASGGISYYGKYNSISDSQSSEFKDVVNVDSGGFNRVAKGHKGDMIRPLEDTNIESASDLQSFDYEKVIHSLKVFGNFVSSGDIFRIGELKSSGNKTVTVKCMNDTTTLVVGVLFGRKWTIPFLDSAGKPGPSVTKGWLEFVGNYDQCHEAVAPTTELKGQPDFKGEYCVVTISNFHPIIRPSIGLCFPDSCSEFDIKEVAEEIIRLYKLDILLDPVNCLQAETKFTTATIMAIVISVIFGCLIICGTLYDLWYVKKWKLTRKSSTLNSDFSSASSILPDHTPNPQNIGTISNEIGDSDSKFVTVIQKVLHSFSAYTNGKSILSFSETSESLGSLHGLRYLSMCWVILGHIYRYGLYNSVNKATQIPIYFDRWSFGVITNMWLSVDTFFAISGILISYKTIKDMSRHGLKINWARFYYHRYWRLTPPYMLAMVIGLGFVQYLGEGPLWPNTQPHDKNRCHNLWWQNVLYINNVGTPGGMCMSNTWYLANNMQFYVISPLMLIPFYFHRVAGLLSCLLFLLVSWITTGVLSSAHQWPATPISISATSTGSDWGANYYIKPWCRIGPFIVGIMAGYFLTHIKGKSLRFKWWVVALGWILSSGSALAVVYGLYGDTRGKHISNTEVSALYNSIARSVWGAAICWIVIACDAGYGGPVNTFLSWSPFVVLGRLTYMIYLIHQFILDLFLDSMGALYYTNDYTMSIYFIGLTVFSTFAAFIFMLAFESPMVALEKHFMNKKPLE